MGLMFDTQSLPLDINGTQVKSVESHKFLGLNIKLTLGLDHEHHSYGEKCPVLALFHHSAQRGRTELHPMAPAYRGVIKSILNTVITVCYGKKKTQAQEKSLQRVIKAAKGIMRTDLPLICRQRHKKYTTHRQRHHSGHTLL